jgi:hypothetical protein
MQALRNGPGNAALIGHSKDDGHPAVKLERHASSYENKEDISAEGQTLGANKVGCRCGGKNKP